MKKSLESLKSKFGQFELSKEQKNAVKGGEPIVKLQCENFNGAPIGGGKKTPEEAAKFCEGRSDCAGCF